MPLYEYKCDTCGDVFELIQKFADAPLTVHEQCGGAVHRLISRSALQFKGSGWYVTDYAKSGAASPSSSASKAEGESAAKPSSTESGTKSESTVSKTETSKPSKPSAPAASEK